jgi:acetyl esterase/lipase
MNQFLLIPIVFSLMSIGLNAQFACENDSTNIWMIPERTPPFPQDVSTELQAIITRSPAPDLTQAKRFRINGTEQWNKHIAQFSAGSEKRIKALIEEFSVTVHKDEVNGITVRYLIPTEIDPGLTDKLFIHLHAGGYVLFGGIQGIEEAIFLADRAKVRVVSIDYSMPPAHPYPAAINDVIQDYRKLILDYPSKKLAIGGTSAGGALALASI